MTKTKKKLIELENRVLLLERKLKDNQNSKTVAPVDDFSYKEVVEEWLNGKKN